jgi:hypothetical protein
MEEPLLDASVDEESLELPPQAASERAEATMAPRRRMDLNISEFPEVLRKRGRSFEAIGRTDNLSQVRDVSPIDDRTSSLRMTVEPMFFGICGDAGNFL